MMKFYGNLMIDEDKENNGGSHMDSELVEERMGKIIITGMKFKML